MTWYTGLVFGLWATFLCLFSVVPSTAGRGRLIRVPVAENHRGKEVPLSLGLGLAVGYGLPALGEAVLGMGGPPAARAVAADWLWLFLALAMVFAAGAYDDRQPSRVHGLRAHFRELARGRVTTGIVKLVAGFAAAAIAALSVGARGAALVLGIPLIAGVTNVFNLLDVAPGRALKSGFCLAAALLIAHPSALSWATVGQTSALLPSDVRERAMLGDAGANLLGFVLGFNLFAQLSTAGMAFALAIVLALHVVAETVTLTRVIRAVPPLRWADDLWRIPAKESRVD